LRGICSDVDLRARNSPTGSSITEKDKTSLNTNRNR
jgi:hypothetical protein